MLRSRFLPWILGFIQKILYLRVRSHIVNLDTAHLGLNDSSQPGSMPVFYVTRYRSLADALVLAKECQNAQLQDPLKPFTLGFNEENQTQTAHRFIPLTRPGRSISHPKAPRYFSDTLQKLVSQGIEDPAFDVKLVPVSVFWGRSPRVEGSFWQMFFADSWAVPGTFRKFFMVLIKGRETHIQLSSPFTLQQLIGDEKTPQRVIAKAHRVIRNRLRKQREAFIGPDLSHRRTLVKSLLEQPKVVQMIERESRKSDIPMSKVQKKAHKIANEIAADYSHIVIRCLYFILKWLWTKLYNGVEVNFGQELQQLATEHTIVYVPSHRSHVDYLLLSYVLYDRLGLVPPHIAAGINLNLPIIGPILRRGGAFFMRRSFSDNPLYAAIFTEYLHRVLDRGFSIEYFIEGGRSRTGKQLPARPGMLGMTLKSYAQTGKKSLLFIPVNFCYERLFEGKSYLGELKGQKKRKESLIQFFQSLRRIKHNFGKVHVTFGEPISADKFLNLYGYETKNQVLDIEYQPMKQISLALGEKISEHINQSASAHPVALLSLILLACPKRAISEHQLIQQLDVLLTLQRNHPYSKYTSTTSLSPAEIITYCEEMDYLYKHPHSLGDIFYLTEKQAHYLSYIRNNVLQIYAIPSLVSLYCLSGQALNVEKCIHQMQHFYNLIRKEFFLPVYNNESFKQTLMTYLKTFEQLGFIETNPLDPKTYLLSKRQDRSFSQMSLLSNLIKPTLERYAITLLSLEHSQSGVISSKELQNLSRTLAERFAMLYQMSSPDYFDAKPFHNIVQFLMLESIVTNNNEGLLIFDHQVSERVTELEGLLDSNLKQSLLSAY